MNSLDINTMLSGLGSIADSMEKKVEILIETKTDLNLRYVEDGRTILELLYIINERIMKIIKSFNSKIASAGVIDISGFNKSGLIEKLLRLNAQHDIKELYKIRCELYKKQKETRQGLLNKINQKDTFFLNQ